MPESRIADSIVQFGSTSTVMTRCRSGLAYTTYTLLLPIKFLCPLAESIDQCIGNVLKHGLKQHVDEVAGKLKLQIQVDLTSQFVQLIKYPNTIQPVKWSINKRYFYP